jgi:hypothetical protein
LPFFSPHLAKLNYNSLYRASGWIGGTYLRQGCSLSDPEFRNPSGKKLDDWLSPEVAQRSDARLASRRYWVVNIEQKHSFLPGPEYNSLAKGPKRKYRPLI